MFKHINRVVDDTDRVFRYSFSMPELSDENVRRRAAEEPQ